jgi:tetratricopeptide (TPR) repeat protein
LPGNESGCAGCHAVQHQTWAGSHHDFTVQEASEQTVLGDFKNAPYTYNGVTSRFFRRDGKFFVTTDVPDGRLADFEIKHTFGVEPLQQYLIELPGGRLQALSIDLADIYRAGRRDADAERALRDGLRMVPNAATLRDALGLTLVRQGKLQEALAEFAAAAKAAPDDPRHTYIYAVALHDAGRRVEAVRLLESAAQRTGDRDVLLALAAYKRAAGDPAAASRYLTRLAEINPDDPATARDGER